MKHAGLERLWIRMKCKDKHQAIRGVYMPNENNSMRDIRKTEKFKRILQVLSMDIGVLGNTPFELMGTLMHTYEIHP